MKRVFGFTFIEVVATLVILAAFALVFAQKHMKSGAENRVDINIIKGAIRETQMLAMSNLPTANIHVVLQNKTITLFKGTNTFMSYTLNATVANSFTINFSNLGQVSALSGSLPYSITVDTETGFIP